MNTTDDKAGEFSRERQLVELWARHGSLGARRTAHDAMALGAQLLLIKSATPHGQFKDRVNSLGLEASTAQRYMAVARRFFHLPDAFLDIVGTATNLVQLLPLDGEAVNALARGEEVNGLSSDALANETAKSVREAVRAAREQAAAGDGELIDVHPAKLTLSVEEERILRAYRKCGKEGRSVLLQMAKLIAHH